MNYQARLGAFVLVALLVLALLGGKIGHFDWFAPKGTSAEVLINDASGLQEQTAVRLAGVRVGSIQSIELQNNRALVHIRLKPGIVLPATTHASLMGGGLVGEKYLALHADPGDTTPLPSGKKIPFDKGGSLNTLMTKAAKSVDDIHHLAESSNRAIEDLSKILRENRRDVRNTIHTLSKASDTLHRTTEEVAQLVTSHRKDLDTTMQQMPVAVENGSQFFKAGKQTSTHINQILSDNRENLYRMIFEFRKAAENLEALSDDLRRNPWKLTNKEKEIPPSPRASQQKMEEMMLTTGQMGVTPARK
ncbi:MAG TPA: MlaD family protein [Mariprofundaceae bacterium]|nr:MlaD family protein [Mariprofundaceae bacterium]